MTQWFPRSLSYHLVAALSYMELAALRRSSDGEQLPMRFFERIYEKSEHEGQRHFENRR